MFIRNSLVFILSLISFSVAAKEISPNLGKVASIQLIQQWNRDVFPDGEGLPIGRGTAIIGKAIYQQHCIACHGFEGMGNSAEELARADHTLTDTPPDKTIGNYWPYASTLFDFISRAMPINNPGSLSADEVYAVTAYLLYLNGIIEQTSIINQKTLVAIKMPNAKGMVNIYNKEAR
ncbi:MAG: cytochrome c [Methylococcales bacterium]